MIKSSQSFFLEEIIIYFTNVREWLSEFIHKHLDNFNIVFSLKNIDVVVDAESQSIILLSSLSRSYYNFIIP